MPKGSAAPPPDFTPDRSPGADRRILPGALNAPERFETPEGDDMTTCDGQMLTAALPGGGRMRFRRLLLAVLITAIAAPVAAQSALRLSAGITAGTDLTTDVVFARDVDVGQSAAPTVAIAYRMGAMSGTRVGVEGRLASGRLEITDRFGAREGTSFLTASLLAAVDGPVFGGLRWDVVGGGVKYLPSEDIEIFREGGPGAWVLGAGLSWLQPVGARSSLVLGARYDIHPFITKAMQSHGFSGDQRVQRVGITVGLERGL